MAVNVEHRAMFYLLLAAEELSPEIPESADVYGWLCGSWDLDVVHYRGINVVARGLKGEVHAARVLEGRAVQDVWIMPRLEDRCADPDRTMNMYGGIIVAVAKSRQQLEAIIREDPFFERGLADVRIIQFRASQRAVDMPKRLG